MTNFAKVSSLIFLDNMRCVADLIFGGVCHRFPDLKLVSVESRRRLDPRRARDLRLAVAQRRRARRAPRVRPAARASTSAARSTAASGSSSSRRSTPSSSTPTTSSSRPTTRTRRASTPARARRRSARATTRPTLLGGLPDDVLAKVLHDNAAARLRPRVTDDLGLDRPRPRVAAHRRRTLAGRVLHLRIDRVERRNAFTQDMYRAIKRAAIWADEQPELDAVCLTGTDEWFGAGGDMSGANSDPEGLAVGVGPAPTTSRSATSSAARSSGSRRSTALCHAGGLVLTAALRRDHRVGPGPLPRPRAAARDPRPVPHVAPGRGRRPRPGPLPPLQRGRDRRRRRPGGWASSAPSCPHDELDARVDAVLAQIAPHRARRACGGEARAQPAAARPPTSRLFHRSIRSPEMVEGMAAFVEKRDPVWPR